jgi:EmrB/QacA subfamily drug resistance transporter
MEHEPNKRIVLLVAAMAAFLTPFMASSVNVALPIIGRQFDMSAVQLSWVATAYLLAAAVFLVPAGRLADIHGRKRVFVTGILVYNLSTLLAAVSPNGSWLVAARLLEGIGASMMFGTGTAIVTSVFPPHERGRALGINVAAVYVGLSVGPTIGGFLTQHLGWRSVFLTTIPIGLLIVALVRLRLDGEWAEAGGERFDWVGSVIYGIGLISLMVGLSQLPAMRGVGLIAGGVLALGAFGFWELRSDSPVLDLRIFRGNRVFTFSNLAALINYSATYGVTFLMSLFLQYIKGLSPQETGLVLMAQPVMQALFSPLAGRLSDHVEPQIVASVGMGLTAAGLFSLTWLDGTTPVGTIIISLLVLGLGFALFSSPNTNAVMSSVHKRLYGVASGTLGTMRLVGQVLSMGIVTLVFAMIIGQGTITPEQYPGFVRSMHVDMLILSALSLLGIFASLSRGKVR